MAVAYDEKKTGAASDIPQLFLETDDTLEVPQFYIESEGAPDVPQFFIVTDVPDPKQPG